MLCFQVTSSKGRLDRVRDLVAELSVAVPAHEAMRELCRRTLASEGEIAAALRRMDVVETSRGLVALGRELVVETTRRLFNAVLSNGWELESVDEARCMAHDAELQAECLRHVLTSLGREEQRGVWALDRRRVARAGVYVVFQHCTVSPLQHDAV